jgi:hypothetical protein
MPELMGPAAMYEGAVASEQRWQSRRKDARQAFLEFQSSFPTATYEDYRKFVDGISEGNSYIQGALPSGDVLKRLAEHNQQQALQKTMQQRLSVMSQQAQLAGQVDALVNKHVLDVDDDNKLLDGIAQSLGYNPQDPNTAQIREMVGQQYPNGLGGARERARTELFDSVAPSLEKIVSTNPNLGDDEIMQLVPGLGGPAAQKGPRRGLAMELIKSVRTRAQQAQAAAEEKAVQDAVEDVRKQIEYTGGKYTIPTGLSAEAQEKVRASVEPMVTAFETKKKAEASSSARNEMSTVVSDILSSPGTTRMFASDPNFRAQVREQLEKAAAQAGFEPQKADVDYIMNRATQSATFTVQTNEKTELADWRTRVEKIMNTEGATLAEIPDAPVFTNPEMAKEAEEFRRDQERIMASRQQKAELATSSSAVSSTIKFLTEDTGLTSQIIRQDIQPDELKTMVQRTLSFQKGGQPVDDSEVAAVLSGLKVHVSGVKSSSVVTEKKALEDAFKAEREKVRETALTGMNGLIDAMSPPDKDGNPTPANAQLKDLINNQLFGPGSGLYPTPRALGYLQDILQDPAFLERTGGNTYMMMQELVAPKEDGSTSDFVAAATQSQDIAFPYGDMRGPKSDYLEAQTSYYNDVIDTSMAEMQGFLDALSNQTIDFTRFNSFVNAMQARADAEAIELRDEVMAAAEQSKYWSTEGAISRAEIQNMMSKISKKRDDTLTALRDMKAKADTIIKSAGITKEDAIIGASPRVAPRSSSPGNPDAPMGKAGSGGVTATEEVAPAPVVGPRPRNRGVTK